MYYVKIQINDTKYHNQTKGSVQVRFPLIQEMTEILPIMEHLFY